MKNSTAKVFMNGRSQAIRLPKAFRVDGTEVNIKKEDNRLIIEPKPHVSWELFFKTFKCDQDFNVRRSCLKDKPRKVEL